MHPRKSFRNRLALSGVLAILVALLGMNGWSLNWPRSTAAQVKEDVPLVIMKSEGALGISGSISYIFTSLRDNKTVYLVDGFTGDVDAYSKASAAPSRVFASTSGPIVLGSNGYTVYEDKDSMVVILDSAGKQLAKFATFPIFSLDVLSNGNIVIASPVSGHFLHLYNSAGKLLRGFGKISNYNMPAVENDENQFLHRGKLVVDAADNIYYVFQYVPLIQKYSSTGKLRFERQVGGKAIDIQQELAGRFLSGRARGVVGGISIINSAAVDNRTGHLWICMNGSSVTGVVYEYSKRGEKIREYALRVNSPLPSLQRVTGARDIALTRSSLYVLTTHHQVLSFDIRDDSTWNSEDGEMTVQEESACGTPQPWNSCTFTCPGVTCNAGQPTSTSSDGSSLDCKAALMSTLQPGYTVISAPCTPYPPGTSGPPPHMRGACKDDVVVCYNGQNSSHSITIDCPDPAPSSCPPVDEGRQYNDCNDGLDNDQDDATDYDDFDCLTSPIIIDTAGNGFHLSGLSDPVAFDFDGNGRPLSMGWTARGEDDAFLVLDRNGNGTIDNSTELFGNLTPQLGESQWLPCPR